MRRACWVLGAISWHRYPGTATHEGDERASTTETRARATRDKGEAFPNNVSALPMRPLVTDKLPAQVYKQTDETITNYRLPMT